MFLYFSELLSDEYLFCVLFLLIWRSYVSLFKLLKIDHVVFCCCGIFGSVSYLTIKKIHLGKGLHSFIIAVYLKSVVNKIKP